MMLNSLQESLNAEDTVNQIRVALNSPSGWNLIFVLVEGPCDCCLYPKFFNKSKASFEYVGGGKGQVEIALTQLQTITRKVLGICDADFRYLEQNYPSIPNIFFTDYHDIEMTMLNDNQTLINAFAEYRLQSHAEHILQDALNGSVFTGYTRWYNEINITGLKFKNFSIVPYYDITTKAFDPTAFLNELNRRSPNKKANIGISDINNFETTNRTTDFFNLCNGHDVIALIVATIKTYPSNKNLSIENFCSVLRASFTINSFKNTKLYADISTWQISHHYQILL
jgi:hypothetical protein